MSELVLHEQHLDLVVLGQMLEVERHEREVLEHLAAAGWASA